MSELSENDAKWCSAYARNAVRSAFTTPPLEPQTEPERALWHMYRNARLARLVHVDIVEAYKRVFGSEPSDAVIKAVDVETRGYYTNPYPGDNILHRATVAPLRARLDVFDDTILRAVADGSTDALPDGFPTGSEVARQAAELLVERTARQATNTAAQETSGARCR